MSDDVLDVSSEVRGLVEAAKNVIGRASEPVQIGRESISSQYVIVPLTALEWLKASLKTAPEPAPYISIRPGMVWGSPSLNGTRLKAETLYSVVWDGWDMERIHKDGWDYVSRRDVLVCCWFAAERGGRTWRKRWKSWADRAYSALVYGTHVDECPWPPTATDAPEAAQ